MKKQNTNFVYEFELISVATFTTTTACETQTNIRYLHIYVYLSPFDRCRLSLPQVRFSFFAIRLEEKQNKTNQIHINVIIPACHRVRAVRTLPS